MPILAEMLPYLDSRFPATLGETWDNTGLLVGRRNRSVAAGMTCLTLTPDVAEEAIDRGVDLIVAHHPVLFRGTKTLTDANSDQETLLRLIEASVAVYAPHTRFDSAEQGINAYLAASLGLEDATPLRPLDDDPAAGAGRVGELPQPVSVREFADNVANSCGVDGLHVVDGGRPVSRVAVACGAAGEFLEDAIRLGCDAFVVGEVRFHSALEARSAGVSLFVPGHYSSERPAVTWLAEELNREFGDVEWFASQVERDPLIWMTSRESGDG